MRGPRKDPSLNVFRVESTGTHTCGMVSRSCLGKPFGSLPLGPHPSISISFPINFVCQMTHSFHQINIEDRASLILGSYIRKKNHNTHLRGAHLQTTLQQSSPFQNCLDSKSRRCIDIIRRLYINIICCSFQIMEEF